MNEVLHSVNLINNFIEMPVVMINRLVLVGILIPTDMVSHCVSLYSCKVISNWLRVLINQTVVVYHLYTVK